MRGLPPLPADLVLPAPTPEPPWHCRVTAAVWWYRATPAAVQRLPSALRDVRHGPRWVTAGPSPPTGCPAGSPRCPVGLPLGAVHPWPDGRVLRNATRLSGWARPARVEVASTGALAGWVRPGRHSGVVLRDALLVVGRPGG